MKSGRIVLLQAHLNVASRFSTELRNYKALARLSVFCDALHFLFDGRDARNEDERRCSPKFVIFSRI